MADETGAGLSQHSKNILTAVAEQLKTERAVFDQRLAEIEKRVDGLDTRLAEVEQALQARVNAVEIELALLKGEHGALMRIAPPPPEPPPPPRALSIDDIAQRLARH